MGAGASTKKISVDAEPEGTQENDAQAAGEAGGALAEVGALLAAYQIESPEDLMRMDAKYHSLKATGAHGFGLLQGLHAELHNIHREKEGKMSLADVVAQARERVSLLMRQVTDESFNNFMCCVDGSPQSDVAYEVVCCSCRSLLHELCSPLIGNSLYSYEVLHSPHRCVCRS